MYTDKDFDTILSSYQATAKDIASKPSPFQQAALDANTAHYQFKLNSYKSYNEGWKAAMRSLENKGEIRE